LLCLTTSAIFAFVSVPYRPFLHDLDRVRVTSHFVFGVEEPIIQRAFSSGCIDPTLLISLLVLAPLECFLVG
jgi:hypothetical protein